MGLTRFEYRPVPTRPDFLSLTACLQTWLQNAAPEPAECSMRVQDPSRRQTEPEPRRYR